MNKAKRTAKKVILAKENVSSLNLIENDMALDNSIS